MAFGRPLTDTNETIKVILKQDDAISPELTDDVYEKYIETLDETLLPLVPAKQPTRFILRLVLPYDGQIKVQNAQIGLSDGKADVRMGFMIEEIRCALIDIENPPGIANPLVFKKDGDGFASKELISELGQYGIIPILYAARTQVIGKRFTAQKK